MTSAKAKYEQMLKWLALREGKAFHRNEFAQAMARTPTSVGFTLSRLNKGGVVSKTGEPGYWRPADLTVSEDECNRLAEERKVSTFNPALGSGGKVVPQTDEERAAQRAAQRAALVAASCATCGTVHPGEC
jgi:hypothetical protein